MIRAPATARLAVVSLAVLAVPGCDRRIDVDFNHAVERQDWDWAEQLLERGADIDARFGAADGYTTLMMVVRRQREPEAVRWLLERGADPDLRTWNGRTAMFIAAANGRQRHLEMLIAAGADVEARTDWGATPLSVARRRGFTECSEQLVAAGATR
jgi:ankyrin repeat protein